MRINSYYKRKKMNHSDCSQELEKCIHGDAVDFSTEGETPVKRGTVH